MNDRHAAPLHHLLPRRSAPGEQRRGPAAALPDPPPGYVTRLAPDGRIFCERIIASKVLETRFGGDRETGVMFSGKWSEGREAWGEPLLQVYTRCATSAAFVLVRPEDAAVIAAALLEGAKGAP